MSVFPKKNTIAQILHSSCNHIIGWGCIWICFLAEPPTKVACGGSSFQANGSFQPKWDGLDFMTFESQYRETSQTTGRKDQTTHPVYRGRHHGKRAPCSTSERHDGPRRPGGRVYKQAPAVPTTLYEALIKLMDEWHMLAITLDETKWQSLELHVLMALPPNWCMGLA